MSNRNHIEIDVEQQKDFMASCTCQNHRMTTRLDRRRDASSLSARQILHFEMGALHFETAQEIRNTRLMLITPSASASLEHVVDLHDESTVELVELR